MTTDDRGPDAPEGEVVDASRAAILAGAPDLGVDDSRTLHNVLEALGDVTKLLDHGAIDAATAQRAHDMIEGIRQGAQHRVRAVMGMTP